MKTRTKPLYQYAAKVERVIDGDTLDLLIDLGFSVHIRERVRLFGIDTPEKFGKTKKAGLVSTDYVKKWLRKYAPIIVETLKDKRGKFGRMLAVIKAPGRADRTLNQELVDRGLAKPYFGGKR